MSLPCLLIFLPVLLPQRLGREATANETPYAALSARGVCQSPLAETGWLPEPRERPIFRSPRPLVKKRSRGAARVSTA
jgi:hypothetical protein